MRRSLLFTLLLSIPVSVAAQTAPPPFVLQGQVLDPSHAPIAAARVTAAPADAGSARSVVTDDQGNFVLPLAAGNYTLTIGAQGFREFSQHVAAPQTGTELRELVLEVAGVRESVMVNAPAGYDVAAIRTATKTLTPLRDVPQSVTVVTQELIRDQLMMSIADVVRYAPGITTQQGENNRDQVIIRGNNSSADFFLNGVRDDVQYYRDLYNLDRVELLKGPNAMMFGRGGGGGVINRVTKDAGFQSLGAVSLQGGAFGNKRVTADIDRPFGGTVALRLNGMYEQSNSFRDSVNLERKGINPTVTIAATDRTSIKLGYEYLQDARVGDRGIPSFQGRPVDLDISTYVGDPGRSHVHARVHLASADIEHRSGAFSIRNTTHVGSYDRGYQNFVPGAVTADKSQITLTAYNNATTRQNLFNQTDVTYEISTGRVRHTFLAGTEIGRQSTDNFRNTGFFNNSATSMLVPYAAPTLNVPTTFRQSATDADNHLRTSVAAAYGQDQIELSRHVQAIAGVRFDRFDLTYHNNRTGDTLARPDNLVSPRAGLVYKPITPLSLYGSYSVSSLPSSGDQFSSLTTITQQAKPEKFINYEAGIKWDVQPGLALTTAVYRLDRTNTRATDPNDATRIVQTGSQRTSGYELGMSGRIAKAWSIAGGYAYQRAFVTSATTAAPAGAQVAQVPRNTLSLWNTYQFHPRLGAGLGIVSRTDVFAAIDDTVTLPGYTKVDAALYFTLSRAARIQMNVENLFNRKYYVNADSNTNISPGFPRAVRIGLTARF